MSAVEEETVLSQYTRDLILQLADTKRLLGMRYAEWILGAPELEAGIACASMAQDEWGHARLLYAMLRDFGDDVDALEHGREPDEYANLQVLDEPPAEWPDLVVMNALVDTAVSVQLEALRESEYAPLRQRVQKMLDEERFHVAHGTAWFRRLATTTQASRDALADAVEKVAPALLCWFGPDGERARALQNASIVDGAPSELRVRFLGRIAPLLSHIDAADALRNLEPSFDNFNEATRRAGGTGPDAETVARIRGDKNRAFLMD